MKKHLFTTMTLLLILTNAAYAEIFKGRCQLENARNHKIVASKEIELKFVNNGQFAQKKISVNGKLGKLDKVSLSGQFTVAYLNSEPRLNLSIELNIPKYKMLLADIKDLDLFDERGDVLSLGSMLFMDDEVMNFSCILSVR